MSEGRDDLRGWIAGEAAGVLPPDGAEDRGWARLNAALAAGAAPRADVLAPPGPGWAPWVVLGVVLAAALGWVLWPRAEVEIAVEVAPVSARELPAIDAAPTIEVQAPGAVEAVRAPEVVAETDTGAVAEVPRAGQRRGPAPVPGDSFAAELRIIAAAQAALRIGDSRGALRELAGHARRFPRGHFAQDREALRAVALCRGGKRRAGERLGREFLAAHPESIHGDRVREACGL